MSILFCKLIKKVLNLFGLTLLIIEMLIVLAVISILVLLIIPNAITILGTANDQGCEALNISSDALDIANELTGDNSAIPQSAFDRVCE